MDYQRISCSLFDRLENLVNAKTKIKITFLNDKNTTEEVEGIVQNIFSENKAEFLLINDVKIRLDKIQSIVGN
jgi:transcriptional antiterminator Rof (Rho-off)